MSSIPQTNEATTDSVGSPEIQQPQLCKAAAPPYNRGRYDAEQLLPGNGSKPSSPTQPMAPRVNYTTTAPLSSLQQGPAPVECPSCGLGT